MTRLTKFSLVALLTLPGLAFAQSAPGQVADAAPVPVASQPLDPSTESPVRIRALSSAEATQLVFQLEQYRLAHNQALEQARAAIRDRDSATAALAACKTQNLALARIANEVIDSYQSASLRDLFAAREPVLGLKRVELENTLQEKSDAVYASRCDLAAQPIPSSTTP